MLKIIFLAIYNNNQYYDAMYEIHKKYLKNLKNKNIIIKYYVIIFKQLTDEDYIIDEDNYIIYVNGNETGLLGILDKTIKVYEIFNNILKIKYDFIVRTNISSFINFKNIYLYLQKLNINKNKLYYIGPQVKLQMTSPDGGIYNKKHFGTIYSEGIAIIMNYALIQNIIDNKEKLDYSIVDDVSIGIYIKNIKNVTYFNSYLLYDYNRNNSRINTTHIVYQNHNNKHNRIIDVNNLKTIANYFSYL